MSVSGVDEETLALRDRRRILLASDDRATIDLFRLVAEGERMEVILPDSGDEALARVRQDGPNLAAIDLAGTAIDGWALYNRLRTDPASAGLKRRGHQVSDRKRGAVVQAIRSDGGSFTGASDPRKGGEPVGF